MIKQRLDLLLVERGMVESRSLAQRLVMAGQVHINGEMVIKPATKFTPDVDIKIIQGPAFVSRGGEKLAAALQAFPVKIDGSICADVGASTGGFTDCLLQNGASRVYAVDVGKGILHWKIRQDPRVVVFESTNARYLNSLPEPIDLITIDVSFISLKILLPVVKNWFTQISDPSISKHQINPALGDQDKQVITLIKPQFEAGRVEANRGQGVIRDPKIHRRVLNEVITFAKEQNYQVLGVIPSPIKGPKGNIEFLAWLSYRNSSKLDTESFDITLDLPI